MGVMKGMARTCLTGKGESGVHGQSVEVGLAWAGGEQANPVRSRGWSGLAPALPAIGAVVAGLLTAWPPRTQRSGNARF